jgi:hypothetical protein
MHPRKKYPHKRSVTDVQKENRQTRFALKYGIETQPREPNQRIDHPQDKAGARTENPTASAVICRAPINRAI